MGTVTICSHCGEIIARIATKNKFCNNCNTPEKRKIMDENNKKLFAEKGLPEYHCKYCKNREEK